MLKTIFTTATLLATLVAQTPQPAPQPAPSPMPSPSPSPGASATPLPSPSVTPSISPTPVPTLSPLPTPLPTPLILPPDAPPEILAVQVSDPVVHGGETISATVVTSTNVAAVEVRMAGRSARIPRTDVGIWQVSYQLPHVPFWMRKNYTAQVIALNTAGLQAERDVTISVR